LWPRIEKEANASMGSGNKEKEVNNTIISKIDFHTPRIYPV
jgi:hypothetical protein